ncbi:MAG: VOC family protein [Clostridiales bacterium]|nr:VOC family protein [Clostridiales bacterium]
MQRIIPSLWFADNNCEEALTYYCSVFPHSKIISLTRYPDEHIDPHFEGMAGKVITAVFELDGQRFIALDGGPYFRFNEAVSFTVECADQAEIDYYWGKLSHVPDSEQCGWCKDRFGLSWQIVPREMERLIGTEAAMRAMMQMKKIHIAALEAAGQTAPKEEEE